MSLHKFAQEVASKGRGDDSLLIHMTPDEVQRLQAFAQANGRSLTINPDTGLPEAGMLSDLFKAVAPIALGAFLGPAGMGLTFGGLSSAVSAGIATGGITALATGSLSRGLMAGLGAYGGAGLADSFMGAGTGALEAGAASAAQGQLGAAQLALGEALPEQAAQQFTKDAAARQLASATPFDKIGAGFSSATSSPSAMGQFAKDNLKYLGAAATPIMAGQMVPTTTKMPENTNPAYIRQKLYDPYTQTYKSLAPVKASEFGGRSFSDAYTNPQTGEMATLQPRTPFGMAGGGIVALAKGGITQQQVSDWFKANPNATPEQVAQTVQSLGGLAANEGLADLIGKQYGMSGLNIGSIYDTLTYQDLGNEYKRYEPTPITSLEQMKGNMDLWNRLEEQAKKSPESIVEDASQSGITKRFTDQYRFANSSQARDAFTDPRTRSAYFTGKLVEKGVSPEAIARYTGITPERASDIYTKSVEDFPKIFSGNLGTVIPAGLEALAAAPSAAQPPAGGYTQFTNEQIGKYLADNPNADIQKAIKDTNADPAAVNRYIASLASGFKGSTDTTGGSGTLGIYKDMLTKGIDPTEYYKAAKANDPKYGGWDESMIRKGYYLDQRALALDAQIAKDKIAADPKLGYDKQWVKFMDDNNYTVNDMAQAFGISKNEVQKRYDAAKAAIKPVTPVTPVTPVINNTFDSSTEVDRKITNPVGNATNPGDKTINKDGSVTVTPNIPYRPAGGFPDIGSVKNAWTAGGGSLGYTSPVPKDMAEFEQMYNKQTDDSLDAYNYLMGKGANPVQSRAASTGIMRPYFSEGMRYKPKFLSYDKEGNVTTSSTNPNAPKAGDVTNKPSAKSINVLDNQGNTVEAVLREDGKYHTSGGDTYDVTGKQIVAGGGMMGYAVGGGLGSLGSYSDGGRLLRGPGDGVSDSIPATIGAKNQPARLADGEFVIPARIVSELGNGSTDAGAKKLYAMMDRVQRARGKTTGKNKVAANSRADKHLPA